MGRGRQQQGATSASSGLPTADATPGSRRAQFVASYRRLKALGGVRPRSLLGIGVTALIGGFLEAVLIFLLIQIALAMAAARSSIALPALVGSKLSLPASLAVAAGALLLLLAAKFVTAAQTARVSTWAVDSARRATAGAFIWARYDLQAAETPSRLQELLTTYVNRIGTSALVLTVGMSAVLSFLTFVAAAVVVPPYAAIVILLAAALFAVVILPVMRLTRRLSQRQAVLNTQYAASVSQVVAMAKETRVFGVSEVVRGQLARQSHDTAAAGYSMQLLARVTPAVYQVVAMLVLLLCLAAAYAFDVGAIGELGTVVVLLVRAISYGQMVNTGIQYTSEAAPYLADLMAKERDLREGAVRAGAAPTPALDEIRFDEVGFYYEPGQDVLQDITFTLRRGQKVGVVGPSGSGKSTLVQLLLRLREPTRGSISVNGQDVRDLDLSSWFNRIALVPQDNVLVPASIADNIRFYRTDPDAQAVHRAARAAHLHDFIESLPLGYDTFVGAGHQDLSGGQRQRLGLARALFANPELIVLDEPTSALDMDSELLVQQTLQSLGADVTLFIVAHRLSTLNDCDLVMVLEGGHLVGMGTHEELLASSPFYRRAVALSTLPA